MLSIKSLKNKPANPAGIIPIIRYLINLQLSLLNFKISDISFLVKIKTANKEAKWRKVIKNIFGVPIIFETSAKCPSEEIGKNSVIDCIKANIISFNIFY